MNILWTYMLTRLLWYACNFVRWILYTVTLHTTKLKANYQMHFIVHSQVHSWLHWIAHSQCAWLYTPNCSRWHTPSLLDLRSQVSSQDTPKHTSGHALKDTSKCTRWHTPSLLDCMLPSKLSRHSQVHCQEGRDSQSHLIICSYGCSCMLDPETCWVADAWHGDARGWRHMTGSVWRAGGGRHVACGMWQVAGGRWCMLAEIMMSVDIIVWTLSSMWPPQQDLTMPHGHGVDNCSLRFCRKGRQLDLGESRSPTLILQRNLLPTSQQLGGVCVRNQSGADGDDASAKNEMAFSVFWAFWNSSSLFLNYAVYSGWKYTQ